MGAETKIEWCDHTFNPWRGCTKVSDGCKNCYADTLSKRNPGTLGIWGPNGKRVVAAESYWKQPLKWNDVARFAADLWEAIGGNRNKSGIIDYEGTPVTYYGRPRVFCASLADVFEYWDGCPKFPDGSAVIQCRDCRKFVKSGSSGHGNCCGECGSGAVEMVSLDHVRKRLFSLIDATPNLDWLLLTKRPENILKMWPSWPTGFPSDGSGGHGSGARNLHNVWLGTSVANPEAADKRIPELLKCRDLSPVLFLSCEPLLGPVDLESAMPAWPGFGEQCRLNQMARRAEGGLYQLHLARRHAEHCDHAGCEGKGRRSKGNSVCNEYHRRESKNHGE